MPPPTPTEQLELARWILDRNIAWIAAAESKVAFVVGIATAMFAGLATAYSDATTVSDLEVITALFAALLLATSVAFGAMVVRSQIHGPARSLIFFGRIARRTVEEYRHTFSATEQSTWIDDFADQIHRNAEIADDKHSWARRATITLMFAGAFWTIAVAMLVRG